MKKYQKPILAIVVVSCLLVLVWGGLKLSYYGKFYPTARVAGVSVAGMSEEQAEEELKEQVDRFKGSTIWFSYKDRDFAYEVDFEKIDFLIEESVREAKASNRLSDLLDSNYPIKVEADEQLEKNIISFFSDHINQEMVGESISLDGGDINYQEAKPEIKLDKKKTWNNFLSSISSLQDSVNIAYQETYPSTSSNLFSTYQKVSNLVNLTPIKIISEDEDKTINQIEQNDIISWLNITNQRESRCKIKKGCLLLDNMDPITSQTTFDKEKLSSWADRLAAEVNKEPTNAKLSFNGKKIVVEEPAQYGYKINNKQLLEQINSLIDNPEPEISLAVEVDKPPVRADTLEKLGIKELVGRGETTFYGSSSNRIHNVRTGASRISGALIGPGETFSAAERVGDVEKSTGYLPEYVIKGKETIKEYGGGLCQVSSTLFRAAIRSGFEIVERHPHAYRVSYYEPPIGMDAAIYVPWTDLKFVNNTKNWVLIQYEMSGYQLAFNVYGTNDGRKVSISEPKSGNFQPPPKPIIIKDKTLKPGDKVVEEKGRQGADAWFKYKVKKDGEFIINQTISSHYQAWPAKIRVGPEKKKDNKKKDNKKEKNEKKED